MVVRWACHACQTRDLKSCCCRKSSVRYSALMAADDGVTDNGGSCFPQGEVKIYCRIQNRPEMQQQQQP